MNIKNTFAVNCLALMLYGNDVALAAAEKVD